MSPTRCWRPDAGHLVPPWTSALRRELVAAYRRGTMDAERCLRTYQAQGERQVLPAEAVVYLATRAALDRGAGAPITAESLREEGERDLADLIAADRRAFEEVVETGRRFFFPGRRPVG